MIWTVIAQTSWFLWETQTFLQFWIAVLEVISTHELVVNNLNAMHTARRSFIESSEKVRTALHHWICLVFWQKYANGDLIY